MTSPAWNLHDWNAWNCWNIKICRDLPTKMTLPYGDSNYLSPAALRSMRYFTKKGQTCVASASISA